MDASPLGALDDRLAAWLARAGRGWRGPAAAAALALVAAAPGAFTAPPLDRDESRFAQATAQMLETGDLVNIRFQDAPRDKKPVGIHWLQAASTALTSSVEKRDIYAYRLPSLLGAMLAAAAIAWGASLLLGPGLSLLAGGLLGGSLLLSTEGFIAKTDAVLCGAVALSMAALLRLYAEARGGPAAGRWARALFWTGQGLAILVKGPIGPMVAGLALLALWAADRNAGWIRKLGWTWGLVGVGLLVGPWAVAITVATDGHFWSSAVGGDLAPKLAGGHESHGAPPGLHLLLSPILLFPSAFLLAAGLAVGWRRRAEPLVRFALAWLIPTWLVFEALPTKLVHYPLPTYPALALLMAAALGEAMGRWPRRIGILLSLFSGAAVAGVALLAAWTYAGSKPMAVATAALALAAALVAALALWRRAPIAGAVGALSLGVLAHIALTAGLLPTLQPLWVSKRAAALVADKGLDPRNGVTIGPVAVAGYAEPSLVFALGTPTEIGDGADAAAAIAEGRPALVESRQDAAFREALARDAIPAVVEGRVRGLDYSVGREVVLTLWRNPKPPPHALPDADEPNPPEPEAGPLNGAAATPVPPRAAAPPKRRGSKD